MALDEQTAPALAVEWAGELLGIPAESRFTRPQTYKAAPMPDVVGVLASSSNEQRADPADFPLAQLQQDWLATFTVELSVMVERAANEEIATERADQLKGFAKALREGVLADDSLGGRVEMASPRIEVAFEWFAELPDETQGHALFATIRLAERIDAPA